MDNNTKVNKEPNKEGHIIRAIQIMDGETRAKLGYPLIDISNHFICELGMREGYPTKVVSLDDDFMFSKLCGWNFTIDHKHKVPDDQALIGNQIAHKAENPIFVLKHLHMTQNAGVCGFVIWYPSFDPAGKKLLQQSEPNFYFSPIIVNVKGNARYRSKVIGFDVIRK